MKFMVEWSTRPGTTYEDTLTNEEALIRAFAKWAPPEGLTIHSFVMKVGAPSGYILVEADDPRLLAEFAAQYLAWNDAAYVPVMDVGDMVGVYTESLTWARSAAE